MSGPASRDGRAGDRVQVIAAIPDGTCEECLAGHQAICPNQLSMGYQFPGGFAEYMIVPREVLAVDGLNRIPDGLSFAEASVAEPLACVLNGQELARVGEGDTVVVIGSGPIGCLHVRLARARGAARIILIDLNPDRLAAAAALVAPDLTVATDTQDPVAAVLDATDGRGADVVITAAASGAAQEQGLLMLARRGRLSLFGGLPKDAATITRRRQPGALPRAHPGRRERLDARAQQARARAHRVGRRARRRPDHPSAAPRRGARGHRDRRARRSHQSHDRTVESEEGVPMPERTVTVASSVGLHARPASLFSQAAAKAGVPVTLTSAAGKSVNAASILGVLSLGIGHGEDVTLASDAEGADAALDELVKVLETDLDKE